MIQVAEETKQEAEPQSSYEVRLDNFEGPLDLLLHLIKQDQIEIWEISISRITRQYLEYLELMEALNIEIAGEFLVMAAALMRIKSQRLLPRPVIPGQDDEGPCSEEELIERLLTYKLFKEAAGAFHKRQQDAGPRFPRGAASRLPEGYLYPLADIDLYALIRALTDLEQRKPVLPAVHAVQLEDVRLEDQVALVLAELERRSGRMTFGGLFTAASRPMEIAVTLLAILELARQQVIHLLQDDAFREIWIVSRESQSATV